MNWLRGNIPDFTGTLSTFGDRHLATIVQCNFVVILQFSSHYDSMHIYGIYTAKYIVANIYKYVFSKWFIICNYYTEKNDFTEVFKILARYRF